MVTQFAPGAAAAAPAADPSQPLPGTGPGAGAPVDVATPQGIPPGIVAPVGTAPGAAVAPPEATPTAADPTAPNAAPVQPAQPAPAYSEDQVRQWQQGHQQFQQLAQELQRLGEEQRRQAEQQRIATESENRMNEAYRTAEAMEPAQGYQFLRSFQQQEMARLAGEIQRAQSEGEQRLQATVAQIAAPLYAQHLARELKLRPEYASRLEMLAPQQMDAYAPVLQREQQEADRIKAQFDAVMAELDQLKRSGQAHQLAATGAHLGGGSGASPVPAAPGGPGPEKGTREHFLSIPGVAQMFGLARG